MFNNIVLAICEELSHHSVAAFRFNFRGVGSSGGEFGDGIGEQEDIKAALAFVSSAPAIDLKRIGLVGYSFGGGVALPVALQEQRISFLALVSPALSDTARQQLKEYPGPSFVIIGDADSIIGFEKFQQNIEDTQETTQYHVVPGADHFWMGFEDEVTQEVARFFITGFNSDASPK